MRKASDDGGEEQGQLHCERRRRRWNALWLQEKCAANAGKCFRDALRLHNVSRSRSRNSSSSKENDNTFAKRTICREGGRETESDQLREESSKSVAMMTATTTTKKKKCKLKVKGFFALLAVESACSPLLLLLFALLLEGMMVVAEQ